MTKLKFFECRNRKLVHFVLLASMLVLQLLLLVVLYSECAYESKVKEKKVQYASQDFNFSNLLVSDFVKSQNNRNVSDSIYPKPCHLGLMFRHLQNLAQQSTSNQVFFDQLKAGYSPRSTFFQSPDKGSSVGDKMGAGDKGHNSTIAPLNIGTLAYKEVLKRIQIAREKLDSLQHNKTYQEVADSIREKIDVHKEKLELAFSVLTLIYSYEVGEELKAENPKGDLSGFFDLDLDNCRQEYIALTNKINTNSIANAAGYELLLFDMDLLLEGYKKAIDLLDINSNSDLNSQQRINQNFRIYRAIVITLLVIMSLILIFITRLTFEYEKRLEIAKLISEKNLKFKNRIVGMISHEIRSPLNIISIYCNTIVKRMKENDLLEAVKAIQFTTNSISILANQVLKFSKSEERILKLNRSPFLLREELVKILDGLGSLVENSENEFHLQIDIDKQLAVNSDVIKIQELFYNIVGNANKFTQEGKIEVWVSCEVISSKSYKMKARIKDNGIGMTEEDLNNVFEAYYQGVISEKVHNLGLGLGLNLCKELVELFNGEIKLESQLGMGTIVSFYIYLEKSELM